MPKAMAWPGSRSGESRLADWSKDQGRRADENGKWLGLRGNGQVFRSESNAGVSNLSPLLLKTLVPIGPPLRQSSVCPWLGLPPQLFPLRRKIVNAPKIGGWKFWSWN